MNPGAPVSLTAFKMELEQLRKDNATLQAMLANTKEYSHFGNFVADSGGMAMRLPQTEESDAKDWVPADAYNMAHEFRARNGNDLTPELIN